MRIAPAILTTVFLIGASVADAGPASGQFKGKPGVIAPKYAVAYVVRDMRNPRTTRVELLLTDVPIADDGTLRDALDPHVAAINLDAISKRNYILVWVSSNGSASMNATFSATMTQYINDTSDGLRAEFTTNTPTKIEGRLYAPASLKTLDGETYSVDVKFSADVPRLPAGTPLAAGGGEPGKALTAFLSAATKKAWPAIKAGSSPKALTMFDKSYNTPAENAESAQDLLNAWIPSAKRKITGGQLRGEVAILEVEGEIFEGQLGLSLVKMVKAGSTWQFDQAARVGMLP
ncbi:MAG: hypothetical protein ACRD2N_24195 [Vicinamibacterales bacterium]